MQAQFRGLIMTRVQIGTYLVIEAFAKCDRLNLKQPFFIERARNNNSCSTLPDSEAAEPGWQGPFMMLNCEPSDV